MSRGKLWNLYMFDLKKGFRENRFKMGVAVFVFLFLANITIKSSHIQGYESSILEYWVMILGGMPEYIKTETSIFELPVSWLLFYAYMFYLVGFYPISDLYGSGTKTLLLSESRKNWLISKYMWIATVVVVYFLLFIFCLILNMGLFENVVNFAIKDVMVNYGIANGSIDCFQIFIIWLGLPVLFSVAIAYLQFSISICTNAISGYIVSLMILVFSAYWMKPFLPANYLMIVRNSLLINHGMKVADGVIFGTSILLLSVLVGCLVFQKKDIYNSIKN